MLDSDHVRHSELLAIVRQFENFMDATTSDMAVHLSKTVRIYHEVSEKANVRARTAERERTDRIRADAVRLAQGG